MYFTIILIIIKYVYTLNFNNHIQNNESSIRIEKRAVLRDIRYKWSGDIFFFYIDSRLRKTDILLAHAIIQSKTCLKFSRSRVKEFTHFEYIPGSDYSTKLGKRRKSPHKIFIPRWYSNPRKIIQVILRALGFNYEHNRSDRDQYLDIKVKNVPSQFSFLFLKQTSENVNTFGLGYDYRSIMHFGPQEFCKFYKKCILTKNGDKLVESAMGKGHKLTFNDAKLVNLQYCLSLIAVRRARCLNYGYPTGIKPKRCLCLRYFTRNSCENFKINHDYCS